MIERETEAEAERECGIFVVYSWIFFVGFMHICSISSPHFVILLDCIDLLVRL